MHSKVFRISKAGHAHRTSVTPRDPGQSLQRSARDGHFATLCRKDPKTGKADDIAPVFGDVCDGGRHEPNTRKGKVTPPRRVANRERRTREHLTPQEVDRLINAASRVGRYCHRDATLILLAYRQGPRVSELMAMRWDQIDLEQGLLHVARVKNGVPSTHPLRGPEIRALRRLRRDYPISPYVFTTERRGAMTAASVRKIITRAGDQAISASLCIHTCCVMPALQARQ
jgi:integrase